MPLWIDSRAETPRHLSAVKRWLGRVLVCDCETCLACLGSSMVLVAVGHMHRRNNTTNRDDTNHMLQPLLVQTDPLLASGAPHHDHSLCTSAHTPSHSHFPGSQGSHVQCAANASMPTLSFWKRSRRHTHDDTGAFSPCWQWIRRFKLSREATGCP
jgi:hypothetical protein